MKCVCVLLVIAISVNAYPGDVLGQEWQLFKMQHAKLYSNVFEEHIRKKIYLRNKLEIIEHNKLYELGQVSFKLGLNKFSDLDHDEFAEKMSCFSDTRNNFTSKAISYIGPDVDVTLPSTIDWRQKQAVTPVKDQGQCGSCWTFSVTGTVEGQTFRKLNKLTSLSEQNLVDCDQNEYNNGCNGGNMVYAYSYIHYNGGIDTEESYPYEAKEGTCRYDKKNSGATVAGYYYQIDEGNEEQLKSAVATAGPVSVAIDAGKKAFQSYKDGVHYDSTCDPNNLNHAVLVVGYGTTTNGQDYWIVKNSWGTDWGNDGYILMARNKGNNCGIASYATYPQV